MENVSAKSMAYPPYILRMLALKFRTVAFLQNQWFHNPARARATYKRNPQNREYMVARALFAGCRTGQRLRQAFGDDTENIIWENTTKEIGGVASSKPKPDPTHIASVIEKFDPHVLLLFGRQARDSVLKVSANMPQFHLIIEADHPAARSFRVEALWGVANSWRQLREKSKRRKPK